MAAQGRRRGGPAGSFLSGLLGLLSVLLLPIALLSLWVSVMLTRTDVFVQEARPLVSTPAVQNALTERVVDGVLTDLDLSPAAARIAQPLIRKAAASVVRSPQMETVWATSMASLHREFTAVLAGRAPSAVDREGRVVISVPIALPALAATLAPFGVAVDPALAPVVTIPVFSVADLQWARLAYSVLDTAGVWAPVAVLGLGVFAVAFAGRPRGAAVRLATGWVITAVGLGVALVAARQPVVDQVSDPTVAALTNAAYGMAQRGLLIEIGAVLAVAFVVFVLLAATRSRRSL